MPRPHELTIDLREEEQIQLERGSRSGNWTARKIIRARVLLLANINQTQKQEKQPLPDAKIAEQAGCSKSSVGNIRKRFSLERLGALEEKSRSGRPKIIDGEIEAHIIAIACSAAPGGRERWTLRLIADRLIELVDDLEDVSFTTIGKALKKMNLSLG
jgi:transposase